MTRSITTLFILSLIISLSLAACSGTTGDTENGSGSGDDKAFYGYSAPSDDEEGVEKPLEEIEGEIPDKFLDLPNGGICEWGFGHVKVMEEPTEKTECLQSDITLTSLNDYYVLTHEMHGNQYCIKTTDTNDRGGNIYIEGISSMMALDQAKYIPDLDVEIEVIKLYPNEHLVLAVRSGCDGTESEDEITNLTKLEFGLK